MDTRTVNGDVYIIDQDNTLVYGDNGLALRLTPRNLDKLRSVAKTLDCIKDSDFKHRRFTVAYDNSARRFRFETEDTSPIYVETWAILPELCKTA